MTKTIVITEKALAKLGKDFFKNMTVNEIETMFVGECVNGTYGYKLDSNTTKISVGRFCDNSKAEKLM